MSGIDFDRQVFATPSEPPRRPSLQALAPALFVLALGAVGFIGYKIYHESVRAVEGAPTAEVELLRQQLTDMQKRLDQVEKHRHPVQADSAVDSHANAIPAKDSAPAKVIYKVISASKLPAVAKPVPTPFVAPSNSPATDNSAVRNELVANHEAWQATTDRLADVVGVVGTQQSEISETREALDQLLAKSKRRAVSFELQRGSNRTPVGPLALQLRSADTKTQRYSVCVYFAEKCIELKDRALNEVVVFMESSNSTPLELVATKIIRDQILGYVEVPVEGYPSVGRDR
jgi:hypothetical protein